MPCQQMAIIVGKAMGCGVRIADLCQITGRINGKSGLLAGRIRDALQFAVSTVDKLPYPLRRCTSRRHNTHAGQLAIGMIAVNGLASIGIECEVVPSVPVEMYFHPVRITAGIGIRSSSIIQRRKISGRSGIDGGFGITVNQSGVNFSRTLRLLSIAYNSS